MADHNLDFALRVSTDTADAVKDVTALDTSLDKVKTSGQSAATGLNATAAAATKSAAALKTDATAATAAAAANTKLGVATRASASAQRRHALSAGELRNAQRQLPAQITDIVTSLASGQPVYMVAIQQGGQLKDSFGGVGAAARAVVGAISPMAIAVTAGAAAFGLIAYAAFQGYQEIQGYERALISTGNVSGATAGQIADMANEVGEATGEFSGAEQAAQQLAASGKIAADALDDAMSAAVNLATLTGESIDATTAKIIKLADSPSATLAKLNEDYHFLTVEVYEHIKALEDQGREHDAVREAVEFMSQVSEQRVEEMIERTGALERAWDSVGKTIRGVWDDLNDLGRTDAEYRLQVAQEALDRFQTPLGQFEYANTNGAQSLRGRERELQWQVRLAQLDVFRAQAATRAAAEQQTVQDAGVAAAQAIDEALEDARTRTQQLKDATGELREEFIKLRKASPDDARLAGVAFGADGSISGGAYDTALKALQKRFKERATSPDPDPRDPNGPARISDAQRAEQSALRELENLRRQTVMLGQVEEGERRVSEEARIRYEIEQGAYAAASEATRQQLLTQAIAKDAAQEQREAEELRQREIEETTRAYTRLQAQLRTPVEAAMDDVTAQIETLNAALDEGAKDAARYRAEIERIGNAALAPAPDFSNELSRFGIGDPEGDRMAAANQMLQGWFTEQMAIINAGRAASQGANAYWDELEMQTRAQHLGALGQLAVVQGQMQMRQVSSIFGSMADMAKSFAGEQSKTYQVLFAISKGFAVAQLATSLAINVSKASEAGFPQNLGLIAAAFAQGAQIASILSGAQYTPQGYDIGGRIAGAGTGTSDSVPIRASVGEFMVRERSARQPGGYAFLEDFNRRGMAALDDWRGYAQGGMITAAPEPRMRMESPSSSVSMRNQMRLYLYQDIDQLRGAILNHPDADKKIVATIGENGGGIQAEWEA